MSSPASKASFVTGSTSRRALLGAALAGAGLVTRRPVRVAAEAPGSVVVNGRSYHAYIPAATKEGQFASYTCEFDAAWVVLQTFGYDVGLDEQVAIVGHDRSIEPYYVETAEGVVIYGGDVRTAYSGDYNVNFLARTTGRAMRILFARFDLEVERVRDREGIERVLRDGKLIWIKTTVDFLDWVPATWVMPDGASYKTVLGNDHAVVVMGYGEEGVVIRDVLGPTSSNWERLYEYEVDWERFLRAWGAHGRDGLAVGPPKSDGAT